MKTNISITAMSSISPLGMTQMEIWENYTGSGHHITKSKIGENTAFAAFLPEEVKLKIEDLRRSQPHFQKLDTSVLYAVYTSQQAIQQAGWKKGDCIGVNIGSSRGATQLFEQYHKRFLEKGRTETLASPTTTLGNISSWVAQELLSSGPEISHSVTCSSGLHAVLNASAFLQAGYTNKFLAGGSEAALTPFTLAQMQAMKIYATKDAEYPCQALKMDKQENTMVLGEGAAVVCLESGEKINNLGVIKGIGYASEKLKHSVSLSANGSCLQKAMKMALADLPVSAVDVVVMHAPGTLKGDAAEVNAVKAIFGTHLPALTSNKWKMGHTFGASGILSLELAVLMLQHQKFIPVPYSRETVNLLEINNVLVNAVGFGGNAVSVLISKVP